MPLHGISRYDGKQVLLRELAEGRQVLHLGAAGETGSPIDVVVAEASTGLHAVLTHAAEKCVGIELNGEPVKAMADAGIFNNIMVADATVVERQDIPLDRIDLIVAGDIIEHLANPGALLDNVTRLSDPHTVLALTTPNAIGLPTFLRYLRGRPLEGDVHLVSFNRYSLGNLLHLRGWTVDWWATCYQQRAVRRYRFTFPLGSWVFRHWPHLGGTLLAVASRTRSH